MVPLSAASATLVTPSTCRFARALDGAPTKSFTTFSVPVSRELRKAHLTVSLAPTGTATEDVAKFLVPTETPPTEHWMSASVYPVWPAAIPVSVIVKVLGHAPDPLNWNSSCPSNPLTLEVSPLAGTSVPTPPVTDAEKGQLFEIGETVPGIDVPICFSTITVPPHWL